MKKNKFILISIFLCVISISMLLVPSKVANAEQIENNKEYSIFLNGYGKYEVKADTAEISYEICAIDESSLSAMQNVNAKMQDIENAISDKVEILQSNKCVDFMHPIFYTGKIKYKVAKICTININSIENIDDIISTIKNNDAKVINIKYSVNEIKQAYSIALKNAIEDAKQTAMNINSNLKVDEIIEKSIICSNCDFDNDSNNIIINAKVVVNFKCDKEDAYIPENIDEDGLFILESHNNKKKIMPF